jgi:hypothetical protein
VVHFGRDSKLRWWSGALSVLSIGALGTSAVTSRPVSPPSVVSAQVPFYPPILQKAHIDGRVELRITTDGEHPVSVVSVSGQPMLTKAAIENVKTWVFAQHESTTFRATFWYRLLESDCDAACNCGSAERPNVVLKLPTEVEISAEEVMICDPATTRAN